MRKRSSYSPKIKSAPMLVSRGMVNDRLEIVERMAVESFSGGWATIHDFDVIADMQGVLILAGSTSAERRPAMVWAKETLGKVLGGIKERYLRTGKMGCNGEELKTLRAFVSMYRDFWLRQPMALYEEACKQLQITYDQMARDADKQKEAA